MTHNAGGLFVRICAAMLAALGSVAEVRGGEALPQDLGAAGEAASMAGPGGTAPAAPSGESIDALQPDAWTVRLEPRAWYVSPSGRVRLPGGSTRSDSVRVERLNLDTPRLSPAGELRFKSGRVVASFNGSAYGLDRTTAADSTFVLGGVAAQPGDLLDVSFDMTTVQVTGGYQVWRKAFGQGPGAPASERDPVLSLDLFGGARVYDVDIAVAEPGAGTASDADEFFVEPILGARAEATLARDFTIDLELSGGYFADSDRSVSSVDVAVAFQWRPHPNVGLQIGWRQLAFELQDGEGTGEFEYPGRLAGVFAGVSVRF